MRGYPVPHMWKTDKGYCGIARAPGMALHPIGLPTYMQINGAATLEDAFKSLKAWQDRMIRLSATLS